MVSLIITNPVRFTMKKIFIAEVIPSENKGEATLMYGIQKSITAAYPQGVMFQLCSWSPERDQITYGSGVKVLHDAGLTSMRVQQGWKRKTFFIYNLGVHILFLIGHKVMGRNILRLFRKELWSAYLDSDVILIGHDNSFSPYHLPLIWFCLGLRKKIAIYGTTIMPKILSKPSLRRWATKLLNRVSLITTREELTYQFLKNEIMIDKAPLYCTADKAFILEPAPPERAMEIIAEQGIPQTGQPLVGVMMVSKGSNVFRAAFLEEELSSAEKYARHSREIAKALDILVDKLDCCLVFLPHSIGPEEDDDDRLVARSIVTNMINKKNTILVENDLSAQDLKSLMGKIQMTVSERTHGGIASATMLTPTLWISQPNDSRTYGIIGKTLGMEDCIYNIEKLDGNSLAKKLFWLWDNQNNIKTRLDENTIKARQLAMQNGELFKRHALEQ